MTSRHKKIVKAAELGLWVGLATLAVGLGWNLSRFRPDNGLTAWVVIALGFCVVYIWKFHFHPDKVNQDRFTEAVLILIVIGVFLGTGLIALWLLGLLLFRVGVEIR